MPTAHLRLRASGPSAAALLPTTAVVILAALASSTLDRTPTTSVASPAPSLSQPASDSSDATSVVLRLPDGSANVSLEDTDAAQQFAARLPVQLTLRDPMGQAKSGRLPTPLGVDDAERVMDPEVARLYYWPPSGDIAIVYEDLGQTVPSPGMVQLGTVTDGLPAIAAAGNRFVVSVERIR
jgi:hypothetical protein